MNIVGTITCSFFLFTAKGQSSKNTMAIINKDTTQQIVEIACGQCQFHMPGKGCDLAIRKNGKCYFVKDAGIDDFGDAHGKNGFCNSIRKATVTGHVKHNSYYVKKIILFP
jgi:hypothetical protein